LLNDINSILKDLLPINLKSKIDFLIQGNEDNATKTIIVRLVSSEEKPTTSGDIPFVKYVYSCIFIGEKAKLKIQEEDTKVLLEEAFNAFNLKKNLTKNDTTVTQILCNNMKFDGIDDSRNIVHSFNINIIAYKNN